MSDKKLVPSHRVWELVTRTEYLTEEQILEALSKSRSLTDYAYILHDKDVYVEDDILKQKKNPPKDGEKKITKADLGKPKPAHYHVVMRFNRPMPVDKLSEWFGGIKPNFFQKKIGRGAFTDSVEYLTHETEKEQTKGKHLYADEEVTCSFNSGQTFREFLDEANERFEKYGVKDISLKKMLRFDVLFYGLTIRELKRNHKSAYDDDMEALNKRRGEHLKDAPMPKFRMNFYISGSGGSGKGLFSEALARVLVEDESNEMQDEDIFCYVGNESVGFETYDGQRVLIWDDCRHQELFKKLGSRGNTFNVFDTKPKRIPQKKKYSQTNLVNDINLVNSVEPIKAFLDGLSGSYVDRYTHEEIEAEDTQKSQGYRRFPICIEVFPTYYNLHVYRKFFDPTDDSLEFEITKHIKAPLRKMLTECGENKALYYELCKEALKPIIELYKKATELYCCFEVGDSEEIKKKFDSLGIVSSEYEDFCDKYYAKIVDYIPKSCKSKDFSIETLIYKFCVENGIEDATVKEMVANEFNDLINEYY